MLRQLFNMIAGRKELLPQNANGATVFGVGVGGGEREVSFKKLAQEGYSYNPIGYKCVREVANSAAQISFKVFRGDEEVADDHPLVMLLERPNPMQARVEFFQSLYSYLIMDGNAYALKTEVNGRPMELCLLRPDRIEIKTNKTAVPTCYEYTFDGQPMAKYDVDPVTGASMLKHFRTFNPLNDHKGLSPLLAAAAEIDQFNHTAQHNIALLQNGTRPTGMMVFKPTDASGQPARLTDDQRDDIKTSLMNVMSGASNAGKPILLEGEFEWTDLGTSPREMDFIQQKNMSARLIALCIGVPSQLVGIPDAQTYSNMSEARLALYEETVFPLALRVISDLNEWLVPAFGEQGLRIEYDFDKIPAVAERTRRIYETAAGAVREGIITRNEARSMIGLGEVDGGDEILIGAQLFPLSSMADGEPEADATDPEGDGEEAYGDS